MILLPTFTNEIEKKTTFTNLITNPITNFLPTFANLMGFFCFSLHFLCCAPAVLGDKSLTKAW